jgi:hypothetical protein
VDLWQHCSTKNSCQESKFHTLATLSIIPAKVLNFKTTSAKESEKLDEVEVSKTTPEAVARELDQFDEREMPLDSVTVRAKAMASAPDFSGFSSMKQTTIDPRSRPSSFPESSINLNVISA